MEKLSGLVLDVYDDSGGAVLRELFSTPQGLPEITKEAHAITPEEYAVLPDDAFALVLVDGDVELKKFATIDEGNTALSVEYFLKTAYKLPAEAQKVAAQNLLAACECFGIEAPEQLKLAGLGSKVLPAARGAVGRTLMKGVNSGDTVLKDMGGLGLAVAGGLAVNKAVTGGTQKLAGLNALAKGKGTLDPSTFKDMAAKGIKAVGGKKPPRDPVTYQLMAKKKMAEAASQMGLDLPKAGEHGLDRAREKTALSIQKQKANLDKAPERAQKFKTHGDTPVKTPAGLSKEALGAMGALMGALTIPEHARTAKSNLAATKGSGGMVMTPRQIQQRKSQMGMY